MRSIAGRVNAHLGSCEACAHRLVEYRGVIAALPLALPPVTPPPEAWTAIQRAAAQPRPRRGRLTWRWTRVTQWSAAGALAAGLLLWNVSLQQQLWRYAEGPQVEKLARRPGRLVILHGTTDPQASGRLFAAVDGRSGHLAVSGLKQLPAGRVYQLSFVRRTAPPAQAATFNVDENGRAWVVVNVPGSLEATDAIVVTEEAAPGSATPTGVRLLEATEWR